MRKILFSTVVWGEKFSFMFSRFGLPALLAEGNLPAMAKLAPIEFRIYTSADDARRMAELPALRRLEELVETKFVFISDENIAEASSSHAQAYKLMAETHRHAIKSAWEMDAGLCLIYPDSILTDGSFATVARHISEGSRAVMTIGLSVTLETFAEALVAKLRAEGRDGAFRDGFLSLEPRSMVRLAHDHLHDNTAAQVVGGDNFTAWPSLMYWPLDGHGWLARIWHQTPMFVHPRRDGSDFKTSSDGDYVHRAVDWEDVSFLTDSDEFLILEQVCLARRRERRPGPADPVEVGLWALGNTDPFNRRFVERKYWFHDGTPGIRDKAEAASDAFVAKAFEVIGVETRFNEQMEGGFGGLLTSTKR